MQDRYLEITFRRGRPIAAYLYLARNLNEKSAKTRRIGPDLVADYNETGTLIGLEIVSPTQVTSASINKALIDLQVPPVPEEELLPLKAA